MIDHMPKSELQVVSSTPYFQQLLQQTNKDVKNVTIRQISKSCQMKLETKLNSPEDQEMEDESENL